MSTTNISKDLFGDTFEAPQGVEVYGSADPGGLIRLLSNFLRMAVFASIIVAVINILISGIEYIGSAGKPETVKKASDRIWISLLGLLIAVSSLALAGLLGKLFFGNPLIIISPAFYGP